MADSKVQPELIELSDDFPFTGDVSGTVADGSITDVKVSDMAASKLTGALPAISGAALTGLPASYTKNASDPATNTNPSAVGALWVNQVSGETYVCTDATTDENVWYNVGGGTGDVQAWNQFQSTNYGYCIGGGAPTTNIMDRWSFASDGNATDWGDLAVNAQGLHGNNSETNGYASLNANSTIYKKSFASGVTSGMPTSGASFLTHPGNGPFGDCDSDIHGYRISGGNSNAHNNNIERFSFANETTVQDHGDLHTGRTAASGHQSETHGYGAGGYTGSYVNSNVIDKFSFTSNTTGTNIAVLAVPGESHGGTSSSTHGYTSGGNLGPPTWGYKTYMEKFSYASEGTVTNAGNLLFALGSAGGSDSTDYGYQCGGGPGNHTAEYDDIGKHSFASDGNSTNIGNLTAARRDVAGLNN